MGGSRIDQYDITVNVDGRPLGTWDKLQGGAVDAEETTYKPGGMGARITLGGSQNVANVTVQKLYDLASVHPLVHWLMSRAGKGTIVIKKQPLDVNGNAVGRPITYTGKLKQVIPPDVDSEAADAALLGLEMVPAGTVT